MVSSVFERRKTTPYKDWSICSAKRNVTKIKITFVFDGVFFCCSEI